MNRINRWMIWVVFFCAVWSGSLYLNADTPQDTPRPFEQLTGQWFNLEGGFSMQIAPDGKIDIVGLGYNSWRGTGVLEWTEPLERLREKHGSLRSTTRPAKLPGLLLTIREPEESTSRLELYRFGKNRYQIRGKVAGHSIAMVQPISADGRASELQGKWKIFQSEGGYQVTEVREFLENNTGSYGMLGIDQNKRQYLLRESSFIWTIVEGYLSLAFGTSKASSHPQQHVLLELDTKRLRYFNMLSGEVSNLSRTDDLNLPDPPKGYIRMPDPWWNPGK